MKLLEIDAKTLYAARRWRVEIFTDAAPMLSQDRWPSACLADLADVGSESLNPSEFPESFVYLGLENVESVSGDPVDVRIRRRSEIKSRSKKYVAGDVLYGRLRPYLRKVFLATAGGLCSTEFVVLKPKPVILPEVLRALLASEQIGTRIAHQQIGAALPRVSMKDLMHVSLPLIPIAEQRIFAEKIAALTRSRQVLKAELASMPKRFEDTVQEFVSAPNQPQHQASA